MPEGVRLVGVLPALAMLAGAVGGALSPGPWSGLRWLLLPILVCAWGAWHRGLARPAIVATAAGFFCASLVLGGGARDEALYTPLRAVLDAAVGGFLIDDNATGARHDPILTRATLLEDASTGDDAIGLRARVTAVRLGGTWRDARGDVALSVAGVAARTRAGEWTAGRDVEMPVTFRRPARYLNAGVPDFERDLALGGTTLFGSAKSAFVVDVLARGSAAEEAAARVRAHVRDSLQRRVGPHDAVSAAIVTAILIGDRTGLPDDVRTRLQAAGTYHVIAISGGNIAILAGLTLLLLFVCGVSGRPAALATIVALLAYAHLVTAGPSVWRATLMAAIYLAARVLDHRTPPWHAMAVAAAVAVCVRPLDVRDVGFILTFGATGALLEGARRAARFAPRHTVWSWVLASVAASLATEIALLPVNAWTFSRVTSAGLLLNPLAVPLMGVVQVAGMAVTAFDRVDAVAAVAGWAAHLGAYGLVSSARLVDVAPWLTARVPPPPVFLIVLYYASLLAALAGTRLTRTAGLIGVVTCAVAIATGSGAKPLHARPADATLRLTVFDVGQGDSALLQFPDRSSLLVDAGGTPFGGGSFDIGARVLAPALWALGVRRLDALLLTHGDPDHVGGAESVIADFDPGRVWEGIPVPRHRRLQELLASARASGATVEQRLAGEEFTFGRARVRVLHPQPPDWERQRVRNDDSVVLEVVYGDVAILMAGDIGAATERTLIPQLTRAGTRILKVAHHGSRMSTSRELLEAWRPQVAIVSAGRGNTFGHPTPEVIQRLAAIGATVLRTDRHGQITVSTNGHDVETTSYLGGKR
ncbi:MAG: DNA internalization-related competence protein ComEC/Rec2 [Acidimicrobiia bacterium]|nr:DNA internalization-related competence protein ComEC/Rec2 [Acidimicrobiia bacterium]